MTIDFGGPAFPVAIPGGDNDGMSKLFYMAVEFAKGYIARGYKPASAILNAFQCATCGVAELRRLEAEP